MDPPAEICHRRRGQLRPDEPNKEGVPRCWADLPPELLTSVSDLLPLQPRLRLRSVCSSWFNSLPPITLPPISHLPWLLFPSNSSNFIGLTLKSNQTFPFGPFPTIAGLTCVGSQYGWVALADGDLHVSLFNPITGSHITLPPLSTLSESLIPKFSDSSIIQKVAFSPNHPKTHGFAAVAVLRGEPPKFVFTTGARKNWAEMEIANHKFADIVYSKEGERFYAITRDGIVLCLYFNNGMLGLQYAERLHPHNTHQARTCQVRSSILTTPVPYTMSLVVTDDMDVYKVYRRTRADGEEEKRTAKEIFVMKWSLTESTPYFTSVSGSSPLNGFSFYVGSNHSMAYRARDFPGMRADRVYFVEEYINSTSYDVCVCDVARGRLEVLAPACSLAMWPPPFWFVPQLGQKRETGRRKRKNII